MVKKSPPSACLHPRSAALRGVSFVRGGARAGVFTAARLCTDVLIFAYLCVGSYKDSERRETRQGKSLLFPASSEPPPVLGEAKERKARDEAREKLAFSSLVRAASCLGRSQRAKGERRGKGKACFFRPLPSRLLFWAKPKGERRETRQGKSLLFPASSEPPPVFAQRRYAKR